MGPELTRAVPRSQVQHDRLLVSTDPIHQVLVLRHLWLLLRLRPLRARLITRQGIRWLVPLPGCVRELVIELLGSARPARGPALGGGSDLKPLQIGVVGPHLERAAPPVAVPLLRRPGGPEEIVVPRVPFTPRGFQGAGSVTHRSLDQLPSHRRFEFLSQHRPQPVGTGVCSHVEIRLSIRVVQRDAIRRHLLLGSLCAGMGRRAWTWASGRVRPSGRPSGGERVIGIGVFSRTRLCQ